MSPTDANAEALTAAALSVDGLVSVHSEVDEPWPATALAAGVRLLERSSVCAQIGLEGLIEGEATREEAFQAELQAYCIAVAKTAAVVRELPHDDEATRAMLGRAFRAALDERELLPTLALDDHTMLVDATRIAAWSGDAFRACRALEESGDAERGSAHERADAMLITLGAATLEAPRRLPGPGGSAPRRGFVGPVRPLPRGKHVGQSGGFDVVVSDRPKRAAAAKQARMLARLRRALAGPAAAAQGAATSERTTRWQSPPTRRRPPPRPPGSCESARTRSSDSTTRRSAPGAGTWRRCGSTP